MQALKNYAGFIAFTIAAPIVLASAVGVAIVPFQQVANADVKPVICEIADVASARGEAALEAAVERRAAEEEAARVAAAQAQAEAEAAARRHTSEELMSSGVIYDGDFRYTWYSQRVLPGDGLEIEGRHVSEEGYVVDAQERIVVASNDFPHGTELDIPFGNGRAIVCDSGCASGTLDIYTDF